MSGRARCNPSAGARTRRCPRSACPPAPGACRSSLSVVQVLQRGDVNADDAVEMVIAGTRLAAPEGCDESEPYERVERFTVVSLPKFEDFQTAPRHPKWQSGNISANLPGWAHFEAVHDRRTTRRTTTNVATPAFIPFGAAGHGDASIGGGEKAVSAIYRMAAQDRLNLEKGRARNRNPRCVEDWPNVDETAG